MLRLCEIIKSDGQLNKIWTEKQNNQPQERNSNKPGKQTPIFVVF